MTYRNSTVTCSGSPALYPDPRGVMLACNDPWVVMMVLIMTLPVVVWHVAAPPAPQTLRSILTSDTKAGPPSDLF